MSDAVATSNPVLFRPCNLLTLVVLTVVSSIVHWNLFVHRDWAIDSVIGQRHQCRGLLREVGVKFKDAVMLAVKSYAVNSASDLRAKRMTMTTNHEVLT